MGAITYEELKSLASAHTGLVCPACRQPVAIIERETDDAITFRCKACGHRWSAAKR